MICERAGQEIKKIVVVGDAYVSPSTMAEAAKKLPFLSAEIISLMWGNGDKDEFCEMQTEIEHRGPEAVDYPKELDEAAKIDGANSFQIFIKILLPAVKPVMLAVLVMALVYNWNDFFSWAK